jgi:hypothetical protein
MFTSLVGVVGEETYVIGKPSGKGADKEYEGMVGAVLVLTRDPVPNVRFFAAKTLAVFFKATNDNPTKKEIKSSIEKLLIDEDKDVKFFAEQSLDSLK